MGGHAVRLLFTDSISCHALTRARRMQATPPSVIMYSRRTHSCTPHTSFQPIARLLLFPSYLAPHFGTAQRHRPPTHREESVDPKSCIRPCILVTSLEILPYRSILDHKPLLPLSRAIFTPVLNQAINRWRWPSTGHGFRCLLCSSLASLLSLSSPANVVV